MKLILADRSPLFLDAWKAQFLKRPEVVIRAEPVIETAADALLLPGNSFGFLDSGLALQVVERFGWSLEEELRRRIREEFEGELLVGQALVLRASALPKPLVYSPLWRTPRRLGGTLNVFLCVRGALLALQKDAGLPRIESISIPALGGGEGELESLISARQVRYAYEITSGLRGPGDKNLTQQTRRERKLMMVPGIDKENRIED